MYCRNDFFAEIRVGLRDLITFELLPVPHDYAVSIVERIEESFEVCAASCVSKDLK